MMSTPFLEQDHWSYGRTGNKLSECIPGFSGLEPGSAPAAWEGSCYGADLEGLGRSLQEAPGIVPVAASDPELLACVRAALAELGYSSSPGR